MAIAEGVDQEQERSLNEGMTSEGKRATRGSPPPPGTNKQAVSAIVAGALRDHGVATGDPEYLEMAQEQAGKAGEVGVPQVLDEGDRDELGLGPLAPQSAPPPSMTEPFYAAPLVPTQAEAPEAPEDIDLSTTRVPIAEDETPAFDAEAWIAEGEEEELDLVSTAEEEEGAYVEEAQAPEEQDYDDPVTSELRRTNAKQEKRLAYLEQQLASQARKTWAEDAERFPIIPPAMARDLAARAGSHKEYKRALVEVNKMLTAHIGARGSHEEERENAREEARREVKAAWGTPAVSTQISPGDQVDPKAIALSKERDGLGGQFVAKGFARLLR
jgi:hypothetical protein